MEGYFIVHENEKFDIVCSPHPTKAENEVPPEQQELYVQMESTNNVIKSLHNTDDKTKEIYFSKLLTLSQVGLVGKSAQPNLALKSLAKLKEEMLMVEGQRIKNNYMQNLGIKALILGAISFAIFIIMNFFPITKPLSMYCLAFMGALLGTWISFGARKFNITFEELSVLEKDMMSPWIRLIYIGACSIVFMLLLSTRLISIEIGFISTTTISTSRELQIVIGILCGLVESKIGVTIYKKAVNLLRG